MSRNKALVDVSAIKVIAPRVLQQVVDFAIQIHGAAGLSDDLPLTGFQLMARSLRLADGPDEVQIGDVGDRHAVPADRQPRDFQGPFDDLQLQDLVARGVG